MFERILKAMGSQMLPRKLSVKESGRAHLWRWVVLQSATPSRRSTLTRLKNAQAVAILSMYLWCIATLSIDSELTGDNSAHNARTQVRSSVAAA